MFCKQWKRNLPILTRIVNINYVHVLVYFYVNYMRQTLCEMPQSENNKAFAETIAMLISIEKV